MIRRSLIFGVLLSTLTGGLCAQEKPAPANDPFQLALILKANDASVLRIEWDPSTFGNYEAILARAKAYKSEPELRSVTEFGVEKNGLRFPSADLTEEAYRGGDGKLFVHARTSVAYKDHKFFTVETEATFKK